MNKRIVFTGGTGKAGRHAVPVLASKGYAIL
jgi:UDP-glucose 4-epimerase